MMLLTTHYSLKTSRGQSLIEVLVAIGVFVAGIATVGLLVLDASVVSRQGVERTQALLLAREGLEAARSIRDADFDNVTAGTHGIALSGNTWVFSGTFDTQDQFMRVVTVADVDIDTKKIQSTVTWQFTQARQNSVVLVDYLTDWNQTHGEGGGIRADISDAQLGGANKRLEDIKIENMAAIDATIDKMIIWWGNSTLIEKIKIDGTEIWKHDGGGTPDGRQPSGTELNVQNFVVEAGRGEINFDEIRFKDSVSGIDFTLKLIMIDGSTKYIFIDL